MGETISEIVIIVIAAVILFGFPLMTMADRTDDVSQLTVKTATTEFVDDVRTTGKLTLSKYNKYVETICSTGNNYDVEMELKILDENPGKKATQVEKTKIGENVYYSMYTSQIFDSLEPDASTPTKEKVLSLKEGDIFSVSAKNTGTTLSQQFKNFLYKVSGNDTYTIAAEHAGIVTANGKGK